MLSRPQIGMLFMGLSLLFFVLSLVDRRRSKGAKTPARHARIRVAIIFAAVGLFLYFGA